MTWAFPLHVGLTCRKSKTFMIRGAKKKVVICLAKIQYAVYSIIKIIM